MRLVRSGKRGNVAQVQIPAKAILADGDDVLAPARILLQELNLLGSDTETEAAGSAPAVFTGPPQSVALIEAGATAASKWWATGLGASVVTAWGAVRTWWSGEQPANQRVALWVAAIVTAAALLGIAYLLASDVRGRAAAAVATIDARATIAVTMTRSAEAVYEPTPTAATEQLVPLPAPLEVSHTRKPQAEESGWRAVALLSNGSDVTKYLVAKGAAHEWVNASDIELT